MDGIDGGAELEELIAGRDGLEGGGLGDLAPAGHHGGFFR
jgi:hypothetical protein